MSNRFMKLSAISIILASTSPLFAAQPVDLSQENIKFLKSMVAAPSLTNEQSPLGLATISQATDFNQTLHVRVQQTYKGYPVHGGDGVMHVPNGRSIKPLRAMMATPEAAKATLSGTMYQDLQKDLQEAPAYIFETAQADKALAEVVYQYQKTTSIKAEIQNKKSDMMVYIDDDNKAHWAFRISFYVSPDDSMPELPVYLIDAMSFKIYKQWNDIKTLDDVHGGGFGGNKKMGQLVYDGSAGNLSTLDIQRDAAKKICYLQNSNVTVTDFRTKKIASFNCPQPDANHNNLFWSGDQDQYNGGYSPNNDALYAGKIISELYQEWYGIPVLTKNEKPMVLAMVTHAIMRDENQRPVYDNAEWNPQTQKMYFGDGKYMFYPLTSLGVGAHEISHGFTEQHSNLEYIEQSGGMNESFSDMAAQAAEFYSSHHNSWKIGAEITLKQDQALRYMDVPSKDCATVKPGEACSIDNVSKYYKKLDVHYSSGIYNRTFYLLSTAPGWDVRKAFNVMLQANNHYWTTNVTFQQGACGVISAANDYKYDLSAVKAAFTDVGIDLSGCH